MRRGDPPVDPNAVRVWNGRHVVVFLGALMVLIAVVIALGPSALMNDDRPAPTEQMPAGPSGNSP